MIEEQMNEMAEAFLRWPLPDDVCADAVACKAGAPHRTGTNLLTAHQALAMIRFVCRPELTSMYADVERLRAELAALRAERDALRAAGEAALRTLDNVRVFVTSRERIHKPSGEEWFEGCVKALRAALEER